MDSEPGFRVILIVALDTKLVGGANAFVKFTEVELDAVVTRSFEAFVEMDEPTGNVVGVE